MKTNSNAPKTLYIGLDVHKAETVIAILDEDREAGPRHYGSVSTSQHAIERVMRRIAKSQKRKLSDLYVCYEASGCGFWIARRLNQMGCQCEVIAPSLIPTRSGDRVKPINATPPSSPNLARSNDLVAVNIPDSTDAPTNGRPPARSAARRGERSESNPFAICAGHAPMRSMICAAPKPVCSLSCADSGIVTTAKLTGLKPTSATCVI